MDGPNVAISVMNEDDTFRILRRPSHHELLQIFRALSGSEKSKIFVSNESRDDWLMTHGWTLNEYRKAIQGTQIYEKMG